LCTESALAAHGKFPPMRDTDRVQSKRFWLNYLCAGRVIVGTHSTVARRYSSRIKLSEVVVTLMGMDHETSGARGLDDALRLGLAAAIDRYLSILADHGFILDAECDFFIRGPMHGAYTILLHAMQTIDPGFPQIERLDSTLGPGETLQRLESHLIEFGKILEAFCTHYHAATGIDPIQQSEDPTGGRVAIALVTTNIAIERLRAQTATYSADQSDTAISVRDDLRAEDNTSAINRHLAMRRAARR